MGTVYVEQEFFGLFAQIFWFTHFFSRKPVEYFIFHFISRNKKYFQISLNYCKITPVLYLTKPVPFPGPGPFNLDCLLCRVFCLWICPFVCLSICLSRFDPTYRLQQRGEWWWPCYLTLEAPKQLQFGFLILYRKNGPITKSLTICIPYLLVPLHTISFKRWAVPEYLRV